MCVDLRLGLTREFAFQETAVKRSPLCLIRFLLQKQVSKASIAKIVGVTRPTIHRFIKTRRLRPHP